MIEPEQPANTEFFASEARALRGWVSLARSFESADVPAGQTIESRWPVSIVDISLGGVNLILKRRFEEGTLLKIELENKSLEACRVLLARVIDVAVDTEGNCLLACAFAKELSDWEIGPFQAPRVHPEMPDARAWIRFPCTAKVSVFPVVAAVHAPWEVSVLDISPGGMRLLGDRPVEPGTLLKVELDAKAAGDPVTLFARVAYCTRQAAGNWMVGCGFASELSDDDVQVLF